MVGGNTAIAPPSPAALPDRSQPPHRSTEPVIRETHDAGGGGGCRGDSTVFGGDAFPNGGIERGGCRGGSFSIGGLGGGGRGAGGGGGGGLGGGGGGGGLGGGLGGGGGGGGGCFGGFGNGGRAMSGGSGTPAILLLPLVPGRSNMAPPLPRRASFPRNELPHSARDAPPSAASPPPPPDALFAENAHSRSRTSAEGFNLRSRAPPMPLPGGRNVASSTFPGACGGARVASSECSAQGS